MQFSQIHFGRYLPAVDPVERDVIVVPVVVVVEPVIMHKKRGMNMCR